MKIAVCDDEKVFRDILKEYCLQFTKEKQIECQIVEYASGEELLCDFSPDILLLDIEMEGIDGLQVKNYLQNQKADTRILFVSSHEEVIPEAFGREVYGFLCKPVQYAVFCRKMQFLLEDILEQGRCVMLETKKNARIVPIRNIQYINAYGKYSKIFLQEEEAYFFSDDSLQVWKNRLKGCGFAMCQRSYLVNLYHVKKIDGDIFLKKEEQLPLSRRMEKEFRALYKDYVWRRAK